MKKLFIIIVTYLVLSASVVNAETEKECFEKVSRSVFKFNKGLDNAIIGPISRGYNKLPEPIKKGTGNFTSNIATLLSIPNHLLQGNLDGAGDAFGSFLINSTVGILGFADVATGLGLEDSKEDLSQTLGVYGVQNGCYFVLPVFGPTTVRDSIAMVGDTFLDPFATMTWRQKEVFNRTGKKSEYIGVKSAEAIDFRADNDQNFESLEKNSIDLYSATKSVYLQNKIKKIQNTDIVEDEDWGNLDN
ncbi:MAG: surface lipoprotein [Candidatus Pelagibacter sp.]|nr:surface lipoprotein [Candidatus Pelagibacter sp.]OUW24252.1 MAG: hypothetical protein CBD34_01340 [Rickettsiales bacterium TMED174]|tara:strand:+ start:133 stop:870 length:738 start_codon:yes stop_codon:yes gene_type:complete